MLAPAGAFLLRRLLVLRIAVCTVGRLVALEAPP